MKTVCLSFKTLYKENGANTKYGYYIDFYTCDDDEYYDLKAQNFDLLCCDGEECVIKDITENYILLENNEGDNSMKFKLSIDEFKRNEVEIH